MFNLIIGFTEGVVDAPRVLEYTSEEVKAFVAPAGAPLTERLARLPTVVMPETGDRSATHYARVGSLQGVSIVGATYRYQFVERYRVPADVIEAAADELDIHPWEFNRHHWAVKGADLLVATAPAQESGERERSVAFKDRLDAVSRLLVDLPEENVDSYLRAFAVSETPTGWTGRPKGVRRLEVSRLLEGLSLQQIEFLEGVLTEDVRDDSSTAPGEPASAEALTPALAASQIHDRADGQEVALPVVDPAGPIFLVHGHDHAHLHLTARILERSTGRDVIVLREKPNGGRTLIEKFEDHAAVASFAVVLLTADDVGAAKAGGKSPALSDRARQNVVFELGFFFGKLGRERVVVLVHEGVEKPSDISGLVYIDLDAAGSWKGELGRELQAASIDVDFSKIP